MPEQGRRFCGILYPDATNYKCDDVLETIKSYFDDWAYILHDKDVEDASGELKKAHYHWVGSLKNPVQISTVINRLEVPAQYVEFIRKIGGKENLGWKGAIRYLIHDSHPEKFQYDTSAVVSNFDILRFLSNRDDVMQIQKIVQYIDAHPSCTYRQLFDFAVTNGCYSAFKSGQYIITNILKEMRGKEVV